MKWIYCGIFALLIVGIIFITIPWGVTSSNKIKFGKVKQVQSYSHSPFDGSIEKWSKELCENELCEKVLLQKIVSIYGLC